MSLQTQDLGFYFFQKAAYNVQPFVTAEDVYSELIWALQQGFGAGRRRKLEQIGSLDILHFPAKRAKIMTVPYVSTLQPVVEKLDRINGLPEELLLHIFKRIPAPADRYACASVCMRWLMLQSHLSAKEISNEEKSSGTNEEDAGDDLKRNLEGRRATDVRLALIALGTQGRGGLGKLSIRGGPKQDLSKAVTNAGLSSVGICCTALKVLSVWDCSTVDDIGFSAIGRGCNQLKVLNVLKCPGFGNAGLQAIAKGCPLLSTLSLESCDGIGDEGLNAVAEQCTVLASVSIVACKNVGDAGIASVVTKCSQLKALRLEKTGITAAGLVSVAQHGKSLMKLKVSSTDDAFLAAFGSGSKLRKLFLSDCKVVAEDNLTAFLNNCKFIEGVQLEKCGLVASASPASAYQYNSLKTLGFSQCEGVAGALVARILQSSYLNELDLSGLASFTDEEVGHLFATNKALGLSVLNLSGCAQLTDRAIAVISSWCPSLEVVTLEGCVGVTDRGLESLAQSCLALREVDISKCSVTEQGLLPLLALRGPFLKTLSLAGCVKVTDKCLRFIQENCSVLEALNVKDCNGISLSKLDSFETSFWRCQVCY